MVDDEKVSLPNLAGLACLRRDIFSWKTKTNPNQLLQAANMCFTYNIPHFSDKQHQVCALLLNKRMSVAAKQPGRPDNDNIQYTYSVF